MMFNLELAWMILKLNNVLKRLPSLSCCQRLFILFPLFSTALRWGVLTAAGEPARQEI